MTARIALAALVASGSALASDNLNLTLATPGSFAAHEARTVFALATDPIAPTNNERNWGTHAPMPFGAVAVNATMERETVQGGLERDSWGATPALELNSFGKGVGLVLAAPVRTCEDDANGRVTQAGVILAAPINLYSGRKNFSAQWTVSPSVDFGYTTKDGFGESGAFAGGGLTNRVAFNFFLCTIGLNSQATEQINLKQNSPANDHLLFINSLDVAIPLFDTLQVRAEAGNEFSCEAARDRSILFYGAGLSWRYHPATISSTDFIPDEIGASFTRRDGNGEYAANVVSVRVAYFF